MPLKLVSVQFVSTKKKLSQIFHVVQLDVQDVVHQCSKGGKMSICENCCYNVDGICLIRLEKIPEKLENCDYFSETVNPTVYELLAEYYNALKDQKKYVEERLKLLQLVFKKIVGVGNKRRFGRFLVSISDVKQTRLDTKRVKQFLEELNVLEQYQTIIQYPRIEVKEIEEGELIEG